MEDQIKKDNLVSILGGIHKVIRNVDSKEGSILWKAIDNLPDKEWEYVLYEIAERIFKSGENFILVQDRDCHWYVIPDNKRSEWSEWCDIDEDDVDSWNVPDYAKEVGGCPSSVKFKDFIIK